MGQRPERAWKAQAQKPQRTTPWRAEGPGSVSPGTTHRRRSTGAPSRGAAAGRARLPAPSAASASALPRTVSPPPRSACSRPAFLQQEGARAGGRASGPPARLAAAGTLLCRGEHVVPEQRGAVRTWSPAAPSFLVLPGGRTPGRKGGVGFEGTTWERSVRTKWKKRLEGKQGADVQGGSWSPGGRAVASRREGGSEEERRGSRMWPSASPRSRSPSCFSDIRTPLRDHETLPGTAATSSPTGSGEQPGGARQDRPPGGGGLTPSPASATGPLHVPAC